MSHRNGHACYLAVLGMLVACHSQPAEPAPLPASYELVSAAPRARGARAAGTEGAPRPPGEGELAEPGSDEPAEPEPEEDDAGTESDAAVAPDAAPGVAL